MGILTIEEHVNQYWETIDLHSLRNALQIVHLRHREDHELLNTLNALGDPDLESFLVEIRERVKQNEAWAEKVLARIAELEASD